MRNKKDNYIKYLEKTNVFLIIFLSIFIILSSILYINIFSEKDKQKNDINISLYKINPNCSELDLEDTSKCLNQKFSSFYFFNQSQVGKNITDEELIKNGGVCQHASIWYMIKAKELGFYADTFIFYTGENSRHEIAIISNSEGYCVEDQKTYSCWRFSK